MNSTRDKTRPFYSIALIMSAAGFLVVCGFSLYSVFTTGNLFAVFYAVLAFFGIALPALAGLRMPFWSGIFFVLIGGFVTFVSLTVQSYWLLLVGLPVLLAGVAFITSFIMREK